MTKRPCASYIFCSSWTCFWELKTHPYLDFHDWTIVMWFTWDYSWRTLGNLSWSRMQWCKQCLTYCTLYTHVSHQLCRLHWLPVGFQLQFKVQVIIYKVLHDIGAGYLRDHLSPIISSFSVRSGSIDALHDHSVKQCHVLGSENWDFSVTVPALWNNISPEIYIVPSLMWLFSQALW